jgi:hypothetical protein
MLSRLRTYAEDRAEEDRARRGGRAGRVESSLEGKARHAIVDDDSFDGYDDDEEEEEARGYFYYAAAETTGGGGGSASGAPPTPPAAAAAAANARRKSPGLITAPVPPDDVVPNADGERVVTIYSTSEKNDLTSMTNQPSVADFSLDGASQYDRSRKGTTIDDTPLTGEQESAGPRRRGGAGGGAGADDAVVERARGEVSELLGNLLATTGAPAFQDDYDDDGDGDGGGGGGGSNSFASPYGFVGFDPDRVPPDVLSASSPALRAGDGRALREVLSDFELRAIGHDGFNADDKSKGGGHYRVVEEVGSFLEGYRKAEVRRIARETSTMMLDRLVKEGVRGLDRLLAGMAREGDDGMLPGEMRANSEGGELNGALVRYLEEAIRAQERRVKRDPPPAARAADDCGDGGVLLPSDESDDLIWNVTRGEDGTVIETIDPNTPAVKRMLREELERTTGGAGGAAADVVATMTVQEKILLLLRLLRDRVKVEAVVGNDAHARNLRVLAYALRAANDEERRALISDELGHSLDVSAPRR